MVSTLQRSGIKIMMMHFNIVVLGFIHSGSSLSDSQLPTNPYTRSQTFRRADIPGTKFTPKGISADFKANVRLSMDYSNSCARARQNLN
jgi:hypothetical protein